MEVKLDVRNIDLRNAQEMVEDNVKQMQKTGRKVALAYAGLLGMAYDEARAILERGRKMVSEAEDRGEKLEAAAVRQAKSVRRGVEKQVKSAEKGVEKVQKRFTKSLRRSEAKAENEIDVQVERVLERLGIPSRDRIVKLSAEIEALSRKIDQAVVQAEMPEALKAQVDVMAEPLPGYGTMTAREIVDRMAEMESVQVAQVKAYELAHDKRVTVTREADRLLEMHGATEKNLEIVVA